jgi:hypothetical protein
MSKTTITLTNNIHGTSCNVRVYEGQKTLLEKQTVYRIRKTLCPESCPLCTNSLRMAGEGNPITEIHGDEISILYKVNPATSEAISESGEKFIKPVKPAKMSISDRSDKEKETNFIHFTQLEAKIMSSALEISEKTKLFDFIRDIRNDAREEVGLGPVCLVEE